ncbi:MAG: hypothetical protein ABI743_14480 [bacterium]
MWTASAVPIPGMDRIHAGSRVAPGMHDPHGFITYRPRHQAPLDFGTALLQTLLWIALVAVAVKNGPAMLSQLGLFSRKPAPQVSSAPAYQSSAQPQRDGSRSEAKAYGLAVDESGVHRPEAPTAP